MAPKLRSWFGLFLMVLVGPAYGQGVDLTDSIKPGDLCKYEIALSVEGKLKVEQGGKPAALPLTAKANHTFIERVESVDARGGVGFAVRHYTTATSESEVAAERAKRALGADRRLIVALRTAEGSLHYSPDGPLDREELELVAEHFDTLCLTALLPGKTVNLGDTWAIAAEAVQHACLFEGLIKSELVGKLTEVKENIATFTITGTAEGIESGAQARVSMTATGTFDVTAKRITGLTWEQIDFRSQGPASPAAEVKATVTLKRSPAEEPKELNAEARVKVPADGKPNGVMIALRYADASGRFQFTYPRDWHVVGRTKDHLVLRLLEKGEFAAQATITAWKKAEPGMHTSPIDFKKVLTMLPGWEPDVAEEGLVPTDEGRWIYRLAARGKQDGVAVNQTFFLLAGPNGDQVAVTFLAALEKAGKIGTRDLELVNGIEFPKK